MQDPAGYPSRSGWAVLTADITARDLLMQRQTEWATELGVAATQTRLDWYIYLVSDYPCKLDRFLLLERTATIIINRQSSESRPLQQAGLPQGLPLSPILSLFFNADLVQT
uniref:WGS project CBMG000000000 data, contig CS5907-c000663 n=1 Tax=Fusarium acuminatum CS5907 TaxID=1318461 RepID=A0A096PF88_9HYPO|nr:unnamed protein product [Fusarium acuminatum CS5907]